MGRRTAIAADVPAGVLFQNAAMDQMITETAEGSEIGGDTHGGEFLFVLQVTLVFPDIRDAEPEAAVPRKPPHELPEGTCVGPARLRCSMPQTRNEPVEMTVQCLAGEADRVDDRIVHGPGVDAMQ